MSVRTVQVVSSAPVSVDALTDAITWQNLVVAAGPVGASPARDKRKAMLRNACVSGHSVATLATVSGLSASQVRRLVKQ